MPSITGIPFRHNVPSHYMKTYGLFRKPVAPRKATCEEAECADYINGWSCKLQGDDHRVGVIRRSSYRFEEFMTLDGIVEFVFAPGQPCFHKDSHTIIPEFRELFIVRDGDQRGNPRGTRPKQHTRAEFWVEEFATHLHKMEG